MPESELTARRFTGYVNLSRFPCPSCGNDAWLDPHGEPVGHPDHAHDALCPALVEQARMRAIIANIVMPRWLVDNTIGGIVTSKPVSWPESDEAPRSLHDDIKTAYDRYFADDRVFMRPDPPPVLTARSKRLLDRITSFREEVVGGLDDLDGIEPKITQIAREQANQIRERVDAALLSLPADHRLCVHGFEALSAPMSLDEDVYRFVVRQRWHRLAPGEECTDGSGSRTVYTHPDAPA